MFGSSDKCGLGKDIKRMNIAFFMKIGIRIIDILAGYDHNLVLYSIERNWQGQCGDGCTKIAWTPKMTEH